MGRVRSRGQHHVLPPAGSGTICRVEATNTGPVRHGGEGQPLSDAPQTPSRPRGAGADLDRLLHFLDAIPARLPLGGRTRAVQHVMEFRHPSWYDDDVFRALARHGVALCQHDHVRFHGTGGNYHGSYGTAALRRWATRLVRAWRGGRDVYAYFNNDPDAVATRNARTLRRLVAARMGEPIQ